MQELLAPVLTALFEQPPPQDVVFLVGVTGGEGVRVGSLCFAGVDPRLDGGRRSYWFVCLAWGRARPQKGVSRGSGSPEWNFGGAGRAVYRHAAGTWWWCRRRLRTPRGESVPRRTP